MSRLDVAESLLKTVVLECLDITIYKCVGW